jgi:hypothetical protein
MKNGKGKLIFIKTKFILSRIYEREIKGGEIESSFTKW